MTEVYLIEFIVYGGAAKVNNYPSIPSCHLTIPLSTKATDFVKILRSTWRLK